MIPEPPPTVFPAAEKLLMKLCWLPLMKNDGLAYLTRDRTRQRSERSTAQTYAPPAVAGGMPAGFTAPCSPICSGGNG